MPATKELTLEEAVTLLKSSAKAGNMSLGTMMPATDYLKASSDIREYFKAFSEVIEEEVLKDVSAGRDTDAVREIKSGIPIEKAAESLAYAHLRRLINHYNNVQVHERWNRALPELKTAGGFAALF